MGKKHENHSFSETKTTHKDIILKDKNQVCRFDCEKCGRNFGSLYTLRRHKNEQHGQENNANGKCVDPQKGIYFLYGPRKTGTTFPVHVQRKTMGQYKSVECEVPECCSVISALERSGKPGHECQHTWKQSNML